MLKITSENDEVIEALKSRPFGVKKKADDSWLAKLGGIS
jgi:hypothetical protein